jgi:hypothetical protein
MQENEIIKACSTHDTDKCEAQVTLESSKRRWWNNIKVDVKEIGVYWCYLAQDMVQWRALVNTHETSGCIKGS